MDTDNREKTVAKTLTNQISNMSNIISSVKTPEIHNMEFGCNHVSKLLGKKMPENLQRLQEEKYPELSMKAFFEFIRTAYQVNDSFEKVASILSANSEIDWNVLAKTVLNPEKVDNDGEKKETNIANGREDKGMETEMANNQEKCTEEQEQNKKETNTRREILGNESQNQESPSVEVNVTESSVSQVKTSLENEEHFLSRIMKKNLSDVLHEGLLDSVLPYMIPRPTFSQPVIKKPCANIEARKSISLTENRSTVNPAKNVDKDKVKSRRKSFDGEIEIHVYDESKNIKKDFKCPQRLLIQNMCYFADVTAGQKLEEMDISVHCDIVIFDWLMGWVKRDVINKSEWPVLEANNVIPIMVSASFLQMEPLLNTCLLFCHDNMTEILKTPSIFTSLNDNLLTRLADLFTNVEVESLKDKKDKIQNRLFCKLILSLANPTPDNTRGHYSSLATLFKCGKCGKSIIRSLSDLVPCVPSSMRIDNRGDLHSKHTRHATWDLNDYIVALRSELRSWRKVYWRLWGDCHFIFCRQCDTYFPINQMDWCCYHSETPQFFINEQRRTLSYPVGRYPCCSQRSFRFEALPNREGCKFREHLPRDLTEEEREVIEIFMTYRDIIALEPPQLFFPEKITRLVARDPSLEAGKLSCKESTWWEGIELAPPRPKLGLLGKIWGGSGFRKPCQPPALKSQRKPKRQETGNTDASWPTSSASDTDDDYGASDCGDSSVEEESCNSEESQKRPYYKTAIKSRRINRIFKTKRNDTGGVWSADLTVRCNQDNQRDFEEKVATQMVALLTRRTVAEVGLSEKPQTFSRQHWNNRQPIGGSYVRLEAEFRDQLTQNFKCKTSTQNSIKSSIRSRSSK